MTVQDHIVVFGIFVDLSGRIVQAALDDIVRILTAHMETVFHFRSRRRQNKDGYEIFPCESRKLDHTRRVDIEQDGASSLKGLDYRLARRSVIVAMTVGMLKNFLLGDHAVEFFSDDEIIMLAVFITGSWRPGRGRDGNLDIRIRFHQLAGHRRLARAGWRRQGQHQAAALQAFDMRETGIVKIPDVKFAFTLGRRHVTRSVLVITDPYVTSKKE